MGESVQDEQVTFQSLGIKGLLLDGVTSLKWEKPTPVQAKAIPYINEGRDVVVASEPGSGKTGTFVLPIMKFLQRKDRMHYALVLEPTRELALQVAEQFKLLGHFIGLKVVTLVGSEDLEKQVHKLLKLRPHVIVATPGRLLHHLTEIKKFNLQLLKVLVLDEVDKMVESSSLENLSKILTMLPSERQTLLFSATMPKEMMEMKNLSLRNPIEIRSSRSVTPRLEQFYIKSKLDQKECHLAALMRLYFLQRVLVFCNTWFDTLRLCEVLTHLGFKPLMLHGKMSQAKRRKNVNEFKNVSHALMVTTDVASRGMDLPEVAVVVNFDLPNKPEVYTHRVGRTARAERSGTAISFVNEANVKYYLYLEKTALNGQKLPEFDLKMPASDILRLWEEKVAVAKTLADTVVELALKEEQKQQESAKRPIQDKAFQSAKKKQKL